MAPSRERTLLLSNLKGGLNRFQADAGRNQYIDGYDVLNEGGDLRRRDAFRSIGSGAPHTYSENICAMISSTNAAGVGNFEAHLDRSVDLALLGGLLTYLYVGTRALLSPRMKFAGVDFQKITSELAPTEHYILVPEYFDGDVWVRMPAWVDETRDLVDGWFVPLARTGRVYWHLDQFASEWEQATVNSESGLWVRFAIRTLVDHVAGEYRGTGIPILGSHSIDAPGARLFALGPVNGLFSVRVANRSVLIIGSDRQERNGSGSEAEEAPPGSEASLLDQGAQLGCKSEDALATSTMHLLDDEGPGVYGVQTWPRPQRDGVNIGSAGLTYGTAGNIKKTREMVPDGATGEMIAYEWDDQQHRGGVLGANLQETVGSQDSAAFSASQALSLRPQDGYTHVRIRCVVASGVGVPLGEEVSAWAHAYAGGFHLFLVYPPWSNTPDLADRFEIYAPHARALIEGQGNYEIERNQEHTLELSDAPYAEDPATISPTNPVFWRIGRELRWLADAGEAWSGAIDPADGRFICTNGRTPLLEYDGRHLRRLRADFESDLAKQISGEAPDSGHPDQPHRAIAKSQLRQSPPTGRFIAFHRQRLFVAGGISTPLSIFWSEVGAANHVWPLLNEDLVRDAQSDPIRGMISFNDRLLIWTSTALHEAVDISAPPFFTFQQVARTIGFVGPNAACIITGRNGTTELVGIAPDGIYAYASGEPSVVVDQWARYLDGGVNSDLLHIASAVFAPQSSAAYFALPPRGSDKCTRILRWEVLRNVFDVWRLSFGVRSMAIDTDELGRERLLVGTDTGLVMTLGAGNTDDGEEIDAYALSPFVQSPDSADVAIIGGLIEARTVGAGHEQQMTFNLHVNGNIRSPLQEGVLTCDIGAPNLGTDGATLGEVRPRAKEYPTLELRALDEARGHSFAFKVGGTCQWSLRAVSLRVSKGASRGRGL